MKNFFLVARETFLLLRREGVFLALLLFCFLSVFFAEFIVASGLRFSQKLFFDVGLFCYHLLGLLSSLYWGARIFSGEFGEGALGQRLCLGVKREEFFLGAFLGLCVMQLVLSFFYLVLWFGVSWFLGFSLDVSILFLFYAHTLLWFVLGALAFFWGSLLSFPLAFFVSLFFWFLGMSSGAYFEGLKSESIGLFSYNLSLFFSSFWDLSVFNLQYFDLSRYKEGFSFFLALSLQAFVFISFFLSLGACFFKRRDIT